MLDKDSGVIYRRSCIFVIKPWKFMSMYVYIAVCH